MPPKGSTEKESKMFSSEVVATLLAATGVTVGQKQYEIMAKLDGTKSISGWEHTFRPIKKRAKEITDMIEKGEFGAITASPAKQVANGDEKKAPAKRARKSKAETEGEGSPPKKLKQEKNGSGDEDDAEGESVSA